MHKKIVVRCQCNSCKKRKLADRTILDTVEGFTAEAEALRQMARKKPGTILVARNTAAPNRRVQVVSAEVRRIKHEAIDIPLWDVELIAVALDSESHEKVTITLPKDAESHTIYNGQQFWHYGKAQCQGDVYRICNGMICHQLAEYRTVCGKPPTAQDRAALIEADEKKWFLEGGTTPAI